MGIYIRLASPMSISLRRRALSRIDYCYRTIRYFQQAGWFIPERIKVWKNATTEALGGKLHRDIEISGLHSDVQRLRSWLDEAFYRDELFLSIVVFEGLWNFDKVKFAGFFSANNSNDWREAYHDVEIDAYGRGEFEDLVDYLLKQDLIENIAPSLISEIKREGRRKYYKPRTIYFSTSAPEYGDLDNLVALHLKDWRNFVDFLYSRLRRDRASWIRNKVAPIERNFFLSAIKQQRTVQMTLKKLLKETLVTEQVGNSVTYLAKDKESFNKLYQGFKEEVFRLASAELPEAETLKKDIQKGLERTETLG